MSVTIPIYCKMFSTFRSPCTEGVCVYRIFNSTMQWKFCDFVETFLTRREDEEGSKNTEVDCNQKERTDE